MTAGLKGGVQEAPVPARRLLPRRACHVAERLELRQVLVRARGTVSLYEVEAADLWNIYEGVGVARDPFEGLPAEADDP